MGWEGGGDESQTLQSSQCWDFPGGPVAKPLCSQCRGHGLDPWSGNYGPASEQCGKKKKKTPKTRPCDWRWKVKSDKVIGAVGPGVGDTKKNQNRTSVPECEWFREEK